MAHRAEPARGRGGRDRRRPASTAAPWPWREAAAERAAAARGRAAGAAAAISDRRADERGRGLCGAILSDGAAAARAGRRRPPPSASRWCAAMSSAAPAAYHDAALLIDDAGCALANYRRTHLEPARRARGPGPRPVAQPACASPARRLGLLIGADIERSGAGARAGPGGGGGPALAGGSHGAAAAPIVAAAAAGARVRERLRGRLRQPATGPVPCQLIVGPDGDRPGDRRAGFAVADVPTGASRRGGPPASPRRRPQLYQRLAAPHRDGCPRS